MNLLILERAESYIRCKTRSEKAWRKSEQDIEEPTQTARSWRISKKVDRDEGQLPYSVKY